MTQNLLEPTQIGDLQLNNRIALAPMTRTRAAGDGTPGDLMAAYYAQRASAGLVIAEATGVDVSAIAWMGMPGAYQESHLAGWKKTTEAVHASGGKIFLQIWHPGRATHSLLIDGRQPVAPSAIRLENSETHTPEGKKPYEVPRALGLKEIPEIIAMFKRGAELAKAADFDGVEIHSANGYLLDQFLQSKTNHRTDAYGGSIESRYRLLDEVVQAVTEVYPANRVGVRLSPNGVFDDMGSPDYREQFTYAAQQLDAYGLAYLHVMDGLAFGFHELGDPMTLAEFRAVFNGPLMGNCGYTPETAEAAVSEGHADLIAFGRPYISNPDLVERIAGGIPLNPEADPSTWYSSNTAEGYTDFTTAT
ncbi:alkene reductase [Pontiellaceae bacterium B12227]|nr:alkene reductase [Pontiellaceae bacterium B12227]